MYESDWLTRIKSNKNIKLRLICFAYAGGSARVFEPLSKLDFEDIEVIAVQLPGRGSRIIEPFLNNISDVVNEFYPVLNGFLDRPYILFGHSLGAKIAHACIRKIAENGALLPSNVVLSGSAAPHVSLRQNPVYKQSDAGFIEQLRLMGGTPDEILANDEIMQILLPVLRADFQISETYKEPIPKKKIDCPYSLWIGEDDQSVTLESAKAWSEHFSGQAGLTQFPGGHMYIESEMESVLSALSTMIQTQLNEIDQLPLSQVA